MHTSRPTPDNYPSPLVPAPSPQSKRLSNLPVCRLQLEKELSSERDSRGALQRELEQTRATLSALQMPSPLGMKMPSPNLRARSTPRCVRS